MLNTAGLGAATGVDLPGHQLGGPTQHGQRHPDERRRVRQISEEELDGVLRIAHALADRTRVRVFYFLAPKGSSVGDLAEAFGLAASTVSHHLGVLLDAGLVRVRAEGRRHLYRRRQLQVVLVSSAEGTFG